MRLSSGIPNFDKLVDQGFLVGSFILLYGPPHVGKSIFCRQFLSEGLKDGEICIYISYDQHPDDVREGFSRLGVDPTVYESAHKLIIVDCFTRGESSERDSLKQPDDVDELNALLNEVFQNLSKKRAGIGGRIVFDSISLPLSTVASPNDLVSMIHSFKRTFPHEQKSMMMVMHEGMQDGKFESQISHAMDVLIDMRSKEEQNRMRRVIWIKAAHNIKHSLEPHEYEITANGLAIVGENYGYVLF